MKKKDQYIFFSLASTGVGISGGDRIFIELARNWSVKVPVRIFTTSEGVEMTKRQNLKGKKLEIENVAPILPKNFLFKYFYKIYLGINLGLTYDMRDTKFKMRKTYLYSSSEFWMDVFPAVLLKIRYPKLKWIATWYQTAPNPLRGFVEQRTDNKEQRRESYKVSALLYWLVQLPVKPLINLYADKVIVNNEDEKMRFPKHTKRGDTIVLIGAVRMGEIEKWKSDSRKPKTDNRFDAVFQGRFHPQKGVVELINIWKKVVDKKPSAKLAMIGDGPLYKKVETRIQKLGLKKNVKLFGYVFDGTKKYKIFSQSKLVVHPAYYDSGGMATAEVMAFGIPAVGFNLKAYESYYPEGMVKVKDEKEFAAAILDLLQNDKKRIRLGKKARLLINGKYSWEKRAEEIYKIIT